MRFKAPAIRPSSRLRGLRASRIQGIPNRPDRNFRGTDTEVFSRLSDEDQAAFFYWVDSGMPLIPTKTGYTNIPMTWRS